MTTPIACPQCGSTEWRRTETNHTLERHWIDTTQDGPEAHTWQTDQEDLVDSSEWTCMGGDSHFATGAIDQALSRR